MLVLVLVLECLVFEIDGAEELLNRRVRRCQVAEQSAQIEHEHEDEKKNTRKITNDLFVD